MNHYDVWGNEPTDWGNDPVLVIADNPQEAAESWGRYHDRHMEHGPFVSDGHVVVVTVRCIRTQALHHFRVRGELLPVYQAQDITGVST